MSLQKHFDPDNTNSDIIGRIILTGILCYIFVYFNYEISRFFLTRWDVWWKASWDITTGFDKAFDDAGAFAALIMFIPFLLFHIIVFLLVLIFASAAWIIGALNQIYVLPFMIPLLIFYSKFSYAFLVRPFVFLSVNVIYLPSKWAFKMFILACQTFLVYPAMEIISLRGQGGRRLYRFATIILFVAACMCLVIGILGVSKLMLKSLGVRSKVSAVVNSISPPNNPYEQNQYYVEVRADHPFWTETGILVERGDKISFSAMGGVKTNNPFRDEATGPKGAYMLSGQPITPKRLTRDYEAKGYWASQYMLKTDPVGSLIGKVGTVEPFFVGEFKEYKVHQAGEVLLGINQVWYAGAWSGNTGAFKVEIIVMKGK
jgi:hypothetical protein